MRIPYLNGPSSHLHEYKILQCSPLHMVMKGKFTISAQSTENTSAPRFTFDTSDQIQLDSNGYVETRNYSQRLITSTTSLDYISRTGADIMERTFLWKSVKFSVSDLGSFWSSVFTLEYISCMWSNVVILRVEKLRETQYSVKLPKVLVNANSRSACVWIKN